MSDVIQTGKCEPKETLYGFDVDSLSQEALRIWRETFTETSSAERADEAVNQFKDRCKSGMFSLASATNGEVPAAEYMALQEKYDAVIAENAYLVQIRERKLLAAYDKPRR